MAQPTTRLPAMESLLSVLDSLASTATQDAMAADADAAATAVLGDALSGVCGGGGVFCVQCFMQCVALAAELQMLQRRQCWGMPCQVCGVVGILLYARIQGLVLVALL